MMNKKENRKRKTFLLKVLIGNHNPTRQINTKTTITLLMILMILYQELLQRSSLIILVQIITLFQISCHKIIKEIWIWCINNNLKATTKDFLNRTRATTLTIRSKALWCNNSSNQCRDNLTNPNHIMANKEEDTNKIEGIEGIIREINE
jgi:hypothetical protein